mmetsp:Transcript_1991/g.4315  ORF Transcript_1991/g.4315 Transcript_1991/m.4315 type:complete len:284 (+) Transcript_1991:989-1840(+)
MSGRSDRGGDPERDEGLLDVLRPRGPQPFLHPSRGRTRRGAAGCPHCRRRHPTHGRRHPPRPAPLRGAPPDRPARGPGLGERGRGIQLLLPPPDANTRPAAARARTGRQCGRLQPGPGAVRTGPVRPLRGAAQPPPRPRVRAAGRRDPPARGRAVSARHGQRQYHAGRPAGTRGAGRGDPRDVVRRRRPAARAAHVSGRPARPHRHVPTGDRGDPAGGGVGAPPRRGRREPYGRRGAHHLLRGQQGQRPGPALHRGRGRGPRVRRPQTTSLHRRRQDHGVLND